MGCTSSSETNTSRSVAGNGTSRQLTPPKESYRYGKPITSKELSVLRSEFWDTRVDGNIIIWQGLKSISETYLNNDIHLCNALLEASGIISPNGTLEMTYDELGHQYIIPKYCFLNPIDMNNNSNTSNNTNSINLQPLNTVVAPIIGNGVGSRMKLKVRINPGEINLTIDVKSSNTIHDLKMEICNQYTVYASKSLTVATQRIIYMGKELKDDKQSLHQLQIDETKVIQVFLRNK